jgi:lipopolysaccharide transport system permease protein
MMGMIALGLGMIISSMVTKYRDLTFLVSFGVQLLMYLSAVMYPLDLMRSKLINLEKGFDYSWIIDINPIAHIIEFGRYILLDEGNYSTFGIVYTIFFTILVFVLGLLVFNKTEKSFIDTI